MPYIKQQDRERLDCLGSQMPPTSVGELNYCITQMINAYLGRQPGYRDYNEVIGVLECAKLEMYRRRIAPYEDTKIEENGDVY